MKKKLVLINPHPAGRYGEEDVRVIVQMPLNLAYIAAYTPEDEWEIDLIDETAEPAVDENGQVTFTADLVGITCLTYQASRAYVIADACRKAMAGDPQSAFGSVLGFNRTVDVAAAEVLSEPGLFVEAIVAPDFEAAAVGVLTTKPKWKKNVRLMQVGQLDAPSSSWNERRTTSPGLSRDLPYTQAFQ